MKELQENRFKEQIQEILGSDCKVKTNVDEAGTLHEAKVNTDQTLDMQKLNAIWGTADAWACELEFARSGSGIRIQFKMNVAALAALNE